jgi:hypothetical protein
MFGVLRGAEELRERERWTRYSQRRRVQDARGYLYAGAAHSEPRRGRDGGGGYTLPREARQLRKQAVKRGRQDLPENPLHPRVSPDWSGLALDGSPYRVLAFCPELGGLEDEPVYQTDPLDPLMRCCASAAVVARPERKPTAIDAPFLSGLKGVAAALAPGENLSSAIGAELRRVERLRLRVRDAQNNDVTGLADRVGRRP